MSVQVHIPSALQALYHTQRIEEIEAGTIADLAVELNERYPGIHDRLMEPDGSLRRYVNVFVEQDDGRWPGEADTQLENGRKVWIVPNIAGGTTARCDRSGDATPDSAALGGASPRYAPPGDDMRGAATP